MKTHTIALIVTHSGFDILQDEYEIECLENALRRGERDPLQEIIHRRTLLDQKESLQADYIEELLSRPFVRPSLQQQGVLWFKSKMKLDVHREAENEAAKVIADYAYQIYQTNPARTDFLLAGPRSQVRIRIFSLAAA